MSGRFEKGAWVEDPEDVLDPSKCFMKVEFFVEPIKGTTVQRIYYQTSLYEGHGPGLNEYAKRLIMSIGPLMEKRTEAERVVLRSELKSFLDRKFRFVEGR